MIELSTHQIEVFGRPNFGCARIAQLLIEKGVYKRGPKKAEYEQAVFIHWASGLLEKHGENWAKAADEIIQNLITNKGEKPTFNGQLATDANYGKLIAKYGTDWIAACADLLGVAMGSQQQKLLAEAQNNNCRLAVRTEDEIDKSAVTAAMIIIYLILNPSARVVLIGTNKQKVIDAVWPSLQQHFESLKKHQAQIAQCFVLTNESLYERSHKGIWSLAVKGYHPSMVESLAGECADNMLTIVYEAAAIGDSALSVIMGSQVGEDNRVILLSTSQRESGYFHRIHKSLNKDMGGPWSTLEMTAP